MPGTRDVLIIGGSGFVSGTIAREALAQGHRVWTVTRGQRPAPEGVTSLIADRHDAPAFAAALASVPHGWDLVVDCIAFSGADVAQDVALLPGRAGQLVYISSDFVFAPEYRTVPQNPDSPHFLDHGYGGGKREGEKVLLGADVGDMLWTVVRPCHIYGHGSQLGCLPTHGRDPELIAWMRRGEPLRLVGGGSLLQQPIYAPDLAKVILSAGGNAAADHGLYLCAGPDVVTSRAYYEIIAEVLGVDITVEALPMAAYREEHPEQASFFSHRVYDLTPLARDGLHVPATPLQEGLREHVLSMI